MIVTDVALKTGENRYDLISEVIDELGEVFQDKCKSSSLIFIKVNLVDNERQLAVTHVDAIRALLDKIRYHTQTTICIGDGGYRGTWAAFKHFGYERLLEEYEDIELVDLNDGEVFEEAISCVNVIARKAALLKKADFTISLTPLKIDQDSGASLSIKNWSIGTWIVPSRISSSGRVWARWPWLSLDNKTLHHQTIVELFGQNSFDLGIIDGFNGMQGDGPVEGSLVASHVALAGFDPVAVDAVGVTLMGIDPADVGYLSLAASKELGTIELSQINIPPMLLADAVCTYEQPVGFEKILTDWKE